jgi:hypothetical protein
MVADDLMMMEQGSQDACVQQHWGELGQTRQERRTARQACLRSSLHTKPMASTLTLEHQPAHMSS